MHGLPCAASGGLFLPCGCLSWGGLRVGFAGAWVRCGALPALRCGGGAVCAFGAGLAFIAGAGYRWGGRGRAVCMQTDVSHANGLRLAACCVLMVHRSVRRALLPCGVRVGLAGAWGVGRGASCQGKGPPRGGIHAGAPPFSEFFCIFFWGGVWERGGMAWGVLAARGMQHEQDMNVTLRNQGECFLRGVRM